MASSLSSTLEFGSEEDTQLFCQPCDRTGRRLYPSGFCTTCKEYLCQACISNHKTSKSFRQHGLLNSDKMPRSTLTARSYSDSDAFDELDLHCEKHSDQLSSFYCQYHEALICNTCKNLEHSRKNCSVIYIPDQSDQTLDGPEYDETIRFLEAFIKKSEQERGKYKALTEKSNASLEESVEVMKNFRRDLDKQMDDLEKAFTDEVRKVSQNTYMNMREIDSTCNNVIKSTKNVLKDVKELNETKQGNKLFKELILARKTIKTNVNLLESKLKGTDLSTFAFEPNKALERIVLQEKSIGKLVVKLEHSVNPTNICAKAPDESNKCWITGMALLSSNVLILTDFLNKSVKLVNVNNNMVICQISVVYPPYDVTKVACDEVAVSVPEDENIILIKVIFEKLVIKQRLKVKGNFCRISYCSGKGFVVTFDSPAKLAILDTKGIQKLSVSKDEKGKDIFAGPDYVTTNNEYIFVSDRVRQAVFRLSWKGVVTGIFTGELQCPQGLSLSDDGTVFVCENSSNKLLAVSPDLKKSSDVISDVKRPCAVCFCDKTKRLFVSATTQSKVYDNYVHIFCPTLNF